MNTPIFNIEENKLTHFFISTIKDIFKKFDMALNKELRFNDFKAFWKCVDNTDLTEDDFESEILRKYTNSRNGLSEKDFVNFFSYIYLNKGEVKNNFF